MSGEPLSRFLERLSSADPTPGGGSASALACAMAAALLAMVSRLTKTRDGTNPLSDTVATMDRDRAALLDLAARDAQAFGDVLRAMRMPKETDEQRRTRQQAIQTSLIEAAAVPLAVAAHGVEVLKAAVPVARGGNANAVSDAGVAALLGDAGVHGAILNVRINLAGIKDAAYVAATETRAGVLGADSTRLREEVMKIVQDRLAR